LCLAKPFGWRASTRYGVRLPQDFTVALGHYEVEDTDPEVEES
jgi:hypothetical protein